MKNTFGVVWATLLMVCVIIGDWSQDRDRAWLGIAIVAAGLSFLAGLKIGVRR